MGDDETLKRSVEGESSGFGRIVLLKTADNSSENGLTSND